MTDSPQPPARPLLSSSIGVVIFAGVFFIEHAGNLYDVVRMPIVRARLFADHPAAWWPALGAAACLVAALAVDRRPQRSRRSMRALEAAVLIYAIAVMQWFVRLGRSGWGAGGDWPKDWIYYQAISDALHQHQIPYYIAAFQQGTERLFANLEAPLAPDAVLLGVLSPGRLYAAHLTACLAAGFIATRAIRDHLQLSMAWWTMWVLLFVMNGNILSHLGAGHTQWAGFFLLPWLFLQALKAGQHAGTRERVVLALTWSAMIVIGSWHVFVWSYIFWLAVVAFRPSLARLTLEASLLTVALSAYRLLPAVLTFGTGSNAFIGGYDSIGQLAASLVGVPSPTPPLQLHEYDSFISWVGFAVLCLAIVPRRGDAASGLRSLWVGSVTLIVLSMHPLYKLTLFNLPGFVSERVATRMAMVGVLGLLLVGFRRLSELAPRPASWPRPAMAAAILASGWLASQLALHAAALRPAVTVPAAVTGALKITAVEPAYFWSVWIGAAVSAIALACVVRSKAWRP